MAAGITPRVVLLGWGNVTRTDDALGPLLMERARCARLPHVTLVEDFQLQIEHALDLQGHALALFADAGLGSPAPFTFYRTEPRADTAYSSHKLAPEAVLDIYLRVLGETPPPAFVSCPRRRGFFRWRLPFSCCGPRVGTCFGFPVATPALSVTGKLAGGGIKNAGAALS